MMIAVGLTKESILLDADSVAVGDTVGEFVEKIDGKVVVVDSISVGDKEGRCVGRSVEMDTMGLDVGLDVSPGADGDLVGGIDG